MGKLVKILIGVIIFLLIMGAAFYFLILRDSTEIATLTIKKQKVEVNTGGDWQQASDSRLLLSDSIRTLDGRALVILHESILINMKENSELSIKDLDKDKPSITQKSGKVWSKFTGMSGIENYEVETPNTVATVRGTAFLSKIEGSASIFISGEGNVELRSGSNSLMLGAGEKGVNRGDGSITKEPLTAEERAEIIELMKESLDDIKILRKKIINKHSAVLQRLMSQFELTEKDIDNGLDMIDRGEIDDNELMNKSPIKVEAMNKVKAINDNIKEQMRFIDKLNEAT